MCRVLSRGEARTVTSEACIIGFRETWLLSIEVRRDLELKVPRGDRVVLLSRESIYSKCADFVIEAETYCISKSASIKV
jgi:hypothetical protein